MDLRRGVLSRQVRFVDAAGRHTAVHQRRFVHMRQPHLAALHTSFTAEDWSGRLRAASGIDGTVANTGVVRYRGMASRHLDIIRTAQPDPQTVLLLARTTQSQLQVAEAARTRVCRSGTPDEPPRWLRQQAARPGHRAVNQQVGDIAAVIKMGQRLAGSGRIRVGWA
jgi:trehalose/maltose hydrolase-like predicted phosphorylase